MCVGAASDDEKLVIWFTQYIHVQLNTIVHVQRDWYLGRKNASSRRTFKTMFHSENIVEFTGNMDFLSSKYENMIECTNLNKGLKNL